MKLKKVTLGVLLLGLGLTAGAQQAAPATGGDASGSGGTVAYSVGLVVYTTNAAAAGSVTQGVQQPYEISMVSGIADLPVSLHVQAYPNPTSDYLTLDVGTDNLPNLRFQLYDLNGKLIEHQKIAGTTETIRMEHLPGATYFLKVTSGNRELKTFKIIKY